jgi:hypothetical protein
MWSTVGGILSVSIIYPRQRAHSTSLLAVTTEDEKRQILVFRM